MNLTLKVWRQAGPDAEGHIETYDAKDIPTSASFLRDARYRQRRHHHQRRRAHSLRP